MDFEEQLNQLRKLAGIYKPYQQQATQENISYSGTEKSQYMKKHDVKPGTDEWFKLWFARPHLTGESPYGYKK